MLNKIAGMWLEFHSDERGVSSVIGVTLMVGVVTILAAVIASAVFGMDLTSWVNTAEDILDMNDSVSSP